METSADSAACQQSGNRGTRLDGAAWGPERTPVRLGDAQPEEKMQRFGAVTRRRNARVSLSNPRCSLSSPISLSEWRIARHITLIEGGEAIQLPLRIGGIDTFGQHRARKPRAFHLDQLIREHVARCAQIAAEAEPATNQIRLAERPAIGEVWKMKLDTFRLSDSLAIDKRIGVVIERDNMRDRIGEMVGRSKNADT